MTEYDLHTQGASQRPTDTYDGNDPSRNRGGNTGPITAHHSSDGGIVFAAGASPVEPPRVPIAAARTGRIYLAGPMTGLPDLNFPAFNAAAAMLRAEGLHVENPAEHGVVPGANWADYMLYDLTRLGTCSGVALLPGWSKSKGARLEVMIALALNMPIRLLDGTEAVNALCDDLAVSQRVVPAYTAAMGQAAQRYMDIVCPGRLVPVHFRWQEIWNAMLGAADTAPAALRGFREPDAPQTDSKAVSLLRDCLSTFRTWAGVAPAVRLAAEVEQFLSEVPAAASQGSDLGGGDAILLARAQHAESECARLSALINNPQTAQFLDAVRTEAAHQRERWGDAHDRSKSAENWFWLVGYLASKCLRAHITGDKQKALHHTISTAAALAQWYDAISRDDSGAGIGQDADLIATDPDRARRAAEQEVA